MNIINFNRTAAARGRVGWASGPSQWPWVMGITEEGLNTLGRGSGTLGGWPEPQERIHTISVSVYRWHAFSQKRVLGLGGWPHPLDANYKIFGSKL